MRLASFGSVANLSPISVGHRHRCEDRSHTASDGRSGYSIFVRLPSICQACRAFVLLVTALTVGASVRLCAYCMLTWYLTLGTIPYPGLEIGRETAQDGGS